MHSKRFWKIFKIVPDNYHDLSMIIIIARQCIKNFSNMYLEVYKIDQAHFISATGSDFFTIKTKLRLYL